MSLEEIKKTELWRRLERNRIFDSDFERIRKKVSRYMTPPKYEIVEDKLVVTLLTEVCQRDPLTQCRRVRIYEFSIDNDNKLLLYKKKGTISTKCEEEYDTSNSGVIDSKYSCTLFDGDGIVLSYQVYTDDRAIARRTLDEYKKDPIMFVNDAHDPHLRYSMDEDQTVDKQIACLRPGIIGSDNNKYIKMYRSEDALAIAHKVTASFSTNGALNSLTHNIFISTLASDGRVNYTPDYINVGEDKYALAIQDTKGKVYFNLNSVAMGITEKNYMKVARGRFLNELEVYRDVISSEPDKESVVDTLDILIDRIEKEKEKEKRI